MTDFYESQSYTDISTQLNQACAWLASLEIDYSKYRIGKYKNFASKLAEDFAIYQQTNDHESFEDKYESKVKDFENAMYEIEELTQIYKGLSEQNKIATPNLVARLKQILEGAEFFAEDNKDRTGRDFSLELSIAANFACAGYKIDLDCKTEADIEVQIGEHTLYIECKRLKSENQIYKNIKKGLSQLETRYITSPNSSNARGLLVLDISKIINPELQSQKFVNLESLYEKAFDDSQKLINQHLIINKTLKKEIGPYTLGVVVRLYTLGKIESENDKLTTAHTVTLSNFVPTHTQDYKLLRHISDEVFSSH